MIRITMIRYRHFEDLVRNNMDDIDVDKCNDVDVLQVYVPLSCS